MVDSLIIFSFVICPYLCQNLKDLDELCTIHYAIGSTIVLQCNCTTTAHQVYSFCNSKQFSVYDF